MSWLLAAVALLLPTYQIRFSVFGIPTTLLELLVLTTIAVALIQLIRDHKATSYKLQAISPLWLLSIFLFVLAGTIAVLIAPDTRAGLGLWKAYIIEPVLLFLVALPALQTSQERSRVVAALAISGLFVAAVGLWQKFFPDGILGFWPIYRSASNMEWYETATRRVTSVYPFPNAVGLLLAPIAVLLRGVLLHSVRRFTEGRKKIDQRQLTLFLGLTAASILMALAVFWARSHGGLLGIVAGLIVLGLLSEHWRKLTLQIIVLLAVLFFLALPFRELLIAELGLRDPSIAIRRKQYKETIRCLTRAPSTVVFGGGLSGYKQLVFPCHKSKAIEIFQYPHNVVLNFWSEMGLLGLAAFVWIVILFYRQGLRFIFSIRRQPRPSDDVLHPSPVALPIALLGAMTALLVHGLVDVPYFKNDLAILFWLLVALMLTATQQTSTIAEKR